MKVTAKSGKRGSYLFWRVCNSRKTCRTIPAKPMISAKSSTIAISSPGSAPDCRTASAARAFWRGRTRHGRNSGRRNRCRPSKSQSKKSALSPYKALRRQASKEGVSRSSTGHRRQSKFLLNARGEGEATGLAAARETFSQAWLRAACSGLNHIRATRQSHVHRSDRA